MTLGENIKTLRERRRLRQGDCAKELGVAQSTWCDWETGKTAPRHRRLPEIAKVLRVSVARLLA